MTIASYLFSFWENVGWNSPIALAKPKSLFSPNFRVKTFKESIETFQLPSYNEYTVQESIETFQLQALCYSKKGQKRLLIYSQFPPPIFHNHKRERTG